MKNTVRLAQLMLILGMTAYVTEPAIAQQSRIPTGTYAAGNRYILIANNGDRTCYQGVSIPSLENSVTVGETTGSLSNGAGSPIAEGWKEYGREIVLNIAGSTIQVTHEGHRVGDYEFQSSELPSSGHVDTISRCLSTTGIFLETSPGYTITQPRIESPQALAAIDSPAPSLPLPSGTYYAQGTMNNNSRREILNRDGKLCIKIVEGPPSPYGGRENVVISSISSLDGQLYIDATNSALNVYSGQALQERLPNATVAFDDGSRRSLWQRSEWTTAGQVGAALEQDEDMRGCIEAQGKFVQEVEGAIIYGRI